MLLVFVSRSALRSVLSRAMKSSVNVNFALHSNNNNNNTGDTHQQHTSSPVRVVTNQSQTLTGGGSRSTAGGATKHGLQQADGSLVLANTTTSQPFGGLQKSMLDELERRRRDWEQEVERMQQDFFQVNCAIQYFQYGLST